MKRIFIFLFALVLVLSVGLIMAAPVAADPGTTYYVSTAGSDETGTGSWWNPWRTVQHAIDQVSSGDTIMVAPGEYAGAVVNKQVVIVGDEGEAPAITSGVPYKVDGAYTTAFRLDAGADGVEIRNFTVNNNQGANFYFAVFARSVNDVTIDSLEVNDTVQGITNWGGSGWTITSNTITDTLAAGGGGIGIFLGALPPSYRTCSDNLIQYNTIDASATAEDYSCPGILVCLDTRYGAYEQLDFSEDVSGNQILDNTVIGNGGENSAGVEIGVIGVEGDPAKIAATMGIVDNNAVQGNVIEEVDLGLYFYVASNLTVTNNDITGSSHGVYTADAIEDAAIEDNTFANNTIQVEDISGGLDLELILDNNTFDRAVVVRGSGIKVPTIFSSIQDAIDAADPGDTIEVMAGTYDEQVVINKSLTLQGAGEDQTFIKFNATGTTPVITVSANDVTIQDLEITNDTQLVQGIRIVSGASAGLTVDHVDFTNLGAGTGKDAWGIYINNSFTNLSVRNCDFVAVNHTTYFRTMGIFAPNDLQLSDFEVKDSTFQKIWTGIYLRSAIDGLEVTGNTFGPVQSSDFAACVAGVYIGDGSDYNFDIKNVVVAGNTFTEYGRGVYVFNYAYNATVSNFEIYGNNFTNSVYSSAVRIIVGYYENEGAPFYGIKVHGNTLTQDYGIEGAHVSLIDFRAYSRLANYDIAITGNEITLSGGPYNYPCSGIALLAYGAPFTNTVIDGNTLNGGNCGGTAGTPPPSSGILLRHTSSTDWPSDTLEVDIIHNDITGFDHGVTIYDGVNARYGGLPTGSEVNINYNNICGNTLYGVRNDNPETVDATGNWWGDASGPYHATTNPSGTGDAVSDNVDYTPWWGANYIGVAHPWDWYTNDSIQDAIDAASAGDTVNVVAGNYSESIIIQKPLSVLGAGANTTYIDLSGDPSGGTVVTIRNLNGDVTFTGFTVKTGPASTVHSNGIYVGGSGLTGGTTTISDNVIQCWQSAGGTAKDNFGLIAGYLTSDTPKLVFTRNTVYGGGSNPVLIEKWLGPTEITSNYFDNTVKNDEASDVIFMMNYGGTTIAQKQLISDNTFDMGWGTDYDNDHRGSGVSIVGSYTGGTAAGGFTNVEISNNVFINLKPYRRGIGLWNNSADGDGGNLANVIIEGNTISSAPCYTGQFGIRILGKATGTTITQNSISSDVDEDIRIQSWNGHEATDTAVNFNLLLGGIYGVNNLASDVVDATYNWWGDASGPYHETLNPDGKGSRVSDNVLFIPWFGDEEMTMLEPHSTYKFAYEVPDVIVACEETVVPVTFETDELGYLGYDGVRFKFYATGPGDVIFKATDSEEHEYTFVNSGYWGPASGFSLPADYSATTDWTLNFTEPGEYTITFSLIEAPDGEVIAGIEGSEIVTVRAEDIIDYYRRLHEPYDEVDTDDLLAAADDWIAGVVPPGFDGPITTLQLLALADEWFAS